MTEDTRPAEEPSDFNAEDLDEVAGGAFSTEFQSGTEVATHVGGAALETHFCSGLSPTQ
jgi:hypothetical protein